MTREPNKQVDEMNQMNRPKGILLRIEIWAPDVDSVRKTMDDLTDHLPDDIRDDMPQGLWHVNDDVSFGKLEIDHVSDPRKQC